MHARNFGHDVTYVRPFIPSPVQTVGVEVGKQNSLWDGRVRQFSLMGIAWLHLATRSFLAGNHLSDKQWDKEQERA